MIAGQLTRQLASWSERPTALGWAGLAGTTAMTVASFWVGAVPVYFRGGHTEIISALGVGAFPLRLLFYVGLSVLFLCWLRLGRLMLEGAAGTDWRSIRRIALAWGFPLLAAIPLSSRDLWAYAAQSQLVLHHLDPYSLGPSALPGAFSVEVSHRWVDTPAPYGPLWLLIGKGIAAVVGLHVGITVVVLRLLAAVGFLVLAACVPTLAERAGGRPSTAMWLIVANPLTLVFGLGGGHNDLLMVGLMSLGLTLATSGQSGLRGLVLGTAVLAAAIAVKSPAVVALAFVVPLWLTETPAGRRWHARYGTPAAALGVAAWSIAVFALITAVSGLGLGWVKQVNSSVSVVSWMSLPSFASILWHLSTGHLHRILKYDAQMGHFRTGGTVLSLVALLALWILATRNRSHDPARRRPIPRWLARQSVWQLLATAMIAIVILGPAVQPWYFIWALSVAGLTHLGDRFLIVTAGLSLGMVAMVRPNGVGLQMNPSVVLFLAVPVVAAFAMLRPYVASRDDADLV